jgi:hypothetical protein
LFLGYSQTEQGRKLLGEGKSEPAGTPCLPAATEVFSRQLENIRSIAITTKQPISKALRLSSCSDFTEAAASLHPDADVSSKRFFPGCLSSRMSMSSSVSLIWR